MFVYWNVYNGALTIVHDTGDFSLFGVKSLQELGSSTGNLLMHMIFGFSHPIFVFADLHYFADSRKFIFDIFIDN